jgi:CheY-like chemotaxis protein
MALDSHCSKAPVELPARCHRPNHSTRRFNVRRGRFDHTVPKETAAQDARIGWIQGLLYWAEPTSPVGLPTMAEHVISTHACGQASPAHLAPKRILIVDDNECFLPVLRSCLETQGYIVCGEARDGVAGIERAKELKPDLIILDMAMPRLNGMEAAAVLKNTMPKVPIVLLTIHDEEVSTAPTTAFGIRAVVSKADGIGALRACLRGLLGSAAEPQGPTDSSESAL